MPLSADQLAWIRSYIGDDDPPSDADLNGIYARLNGVAATTVEVLRKRRAELLAGPLSFAVDGYSQNAAANIAALDKMLSSLTIEVELETGDGTARTVRLTRVAPHR